MKARRRNAGILSAYLAEPTFEINTGWEIEFADPWGNVIGLTDYVKDPAKALPANQYADRSGVIRGRIREEMFLLAEKGLRQL